MMNPERWRVPAAVLALCVTGAAGAQAYPNKPVRIVVTLAPGGTADILARLAAQKLAEAWGQQVVVDNRPGASGMIGTEIVAKAAADGYTLLMGYNAEIAINPSLFAKMPYDPMRDLAPITIAGTTPMLLVVHPSVPARSVKELVALARTRPGQLTFGSAGNGSTPHLGGELLKRSAGVDMTHVPYKSAALVVPELLGGQVSMLFSGMPLAMPHVRANKLRPLAVSVGKRSTVLPEVPTMIESGIAGFDITNWFGLFAPAGTPNEVIRKIYTDVARGMNAADVKNRIVRDGGEIDTIAPEAFARFLREEVVKYARIIKESGAAPS